MLVLTRRPGEVIIIDTGAELIEVVITEVRGHKVRVGVRANDEVRICRGESNGS